MLDSYTGQSGIYLVTKLKNKLIISGSSDDYSRKSSQEYITSKNLSLFEGNQARENKYQGLSSTELLGNVYSNNPIFFF